jgi:hypothetical protein
VGTAQEQLAALAEIVELLDRRGTDHWLFGGWAVDFHVGYATREHDDVDLAVWRDDVKGIANVLVCTGWRHAPEPDEDGGTGFERGAVRVELTYLVAGDDGRAFVALKDRNALFSETPLGDERRELHGVEARVLPLAPLRAGKTNARDEPADAAKDRADVDALARLGD